MGQGYRAFVEHGGGAQMTDGLSSNRRNGVIKSAGGNLP